MQDCSIPAVTLSNALMPYPCHHLARTNCVDPQYYTDIACYCAYGLRLRISLVHSCVVIQTLRRYVHHVHHAIVCRSINLSYATTCPPVNVQRPQGT